MGFHQRRIAAHERRPEPPVFRGTFVPVQTLLDYPEGGQRLDEFLADFPTVSREQAIAVLELAREALVSDARPDR